MLIDTHSHLNFKMYDADREDVIKRTQKEGMFCIDVGTKYETSRKAVRLAESNDNIYAAIGLHPIYASEEIFDKEKYKELAKSNKVVAIGEIGLDYYRDYGNFKEKQKEVFIKQLDLAKELNLPVILHCRMAHDDIIKILENYIVITGVVHCFTGSWEQAERYLKMGFHLGFDGIIYKLYLNEVIKDCPLGKILIETDCPYLIPPLARRSPQGEGGRNEPVFVKYIAENIAEIKNLDFEKVAEITTQNAKTLFGI